LGKHIERTLPAYFADNILLTTSGNFSDQALINSILTVGADNIMFLGRLPVPGNRSRRELDRAHSDQRERPPKDRRRQRAPPPGHCRSDSIRLVSSAR
jgi:hypothetical protein